jgi:iron(III) transport system substrate-binding protein
MKKISLYLIVTMLVVSFLAACQPAEVAPDPDVITDTELNVLCTPQEQWCQGMKQEFEALYGITVNYVRMSSGEALARIDAEKDNPPLISGGVARSIVLLQPKKKVYWKHMIHPIMAISVIQN